VRSVLVGWSGRSSAAARSSRSKGVPRQPAARTSSAYRRGWASVVITTGRAAFSTRSSRSIGTSGGGHGHQSPHWGARDEEARCPEDGYLFARCVPGGLSPGYADHTVDRPIASRHLAGPPPGARLRGDRRTPCPRYAGLARSPLACDTTVIRETRPIEFCGPQLSSAVPSRSATRACPATARCSSDVKAGGGDRRRRVAPSQRRPADRGAMPGGGLSGQKG
jgi:hypothetical protein